MITKMKLQKLIYNEKYSLMACSSPFICRYLQTSFFHTWYLIAYVFLEGKEKNKKISIVHFLDCCERSKTRDIFISLWRSASVGIYERHCREKFVSSLPTPSLSLVASSRAYITYTPLGSFTETSNPRTYWSTRPVTWNSWVSLPPSLPPFRSNFLWLNLRYLSHLGRPWIEQIHWPLQDYDVRRYSRVLSSGSHSEFGIQ